mmetsp:Transcript_9549/g.29953  ORF Transcript_9549/g.29953 Transcript_9549/m.29953 type:complete len:377 (-) Transcript_9549:508-1638(-)
MSDKKIAYAQKVDEILAKYSKAFLVHADNVGSKQFADIRMALRAFDTVVLMGKNTLMKKCMRNYVKKSGDDKWDCLAEMMVGNVGLVFTNGDLAEVRGKIGEFKLPAPARVGAIAPVDVIIPCGPTGMDPSKTSFFQALNVPTKITKGTIEIISDVKVVSIGDKVGGSEAILMSTMGLKPFEYGLEVLEVIENGQHYSAKVLDITDDDMAARFGETLNRVTALAMAAKYPALSTVPHHIVNTFKDVISVTLGLETYSFELADKIKDTLAKIASGEFVVAAAPAAGGGAAAAAAPEPEPEEEEEEEENDDEGPSDKELRKEIEAYLNTADLTKVTMKIVRAHLADKFGDLSTRREDIKRLVVEVQTEMEEDNQPLRG